MSDSERPINVDVQELRAYWDAVPAPDAVDFLFRRYESLARYLAKRALAKAPPHQDVDDIISFAHHGLIDAIRRFDPEAGVKFETYATRRVTGAIIDEQRRMDPLPRTMRTKVKAIVSATEELWELLERDPSVAEISEVTDMSESEIRDALAHQKTMVAELETSSVDEVREIVSEAVTGGELAALRSVVARQCSRSPEGHRNLLLQAYYEGAEPKEVASRAGMSVQTLKNLQSELLRSLVP